MSPALASSPPHPPFPAAVHLVVPELGPQPWSWGQAAPPLFPGTPGQSRGPRAGGGGPGGCFSESKDTHFLLCAETTRDSSRVINLGLSSGGEGP